MPAIVRRVADEGFGSIAQYRCRRWRSVGANTCQIVTQDGVGKVIRQQCQFAGRLLPRCEDGGYRKACNHCGRQEAFENEKLHLWRNSQEVDGATSDRREKRRDDRDFHDRERRPNRPLVKGMCEDDDRHKK